ncbi:MAG: transglutaminase domain-containing protein [Bacteroides sp.]|nr:transglutaminase domain-containing protein [Bacteroides sp.]
MSLPDKADYSEDFYLSNIDASLRAREEMPWGKNVPDREFLHFVLPVRVNNENLDNARMVFYEELKDRVKGLPMKDAILEVNHWCHEKMTYKPSDARTSSPLSSVSQAIGRCGEESTFTVAALRSVGIPARQIYTPRWAHTDDNHAWVEAWADGEWHFLGACEPEPILDLAWFNDPASRGILMNTNVVGDYQGPEEVLLKQPLSTRINVTSNYAPVATLPVTVRYPDGTPANGAKVNFCIYNYAEYYPAVTKTADAEGKASLTAGLGDLVVWATDGKNFGWAKGNAKDFESSPSGLDIVLDKDGSYAGAFELDIVPPPSGAKLPKATPAQRAENDRRLHEEDSIRNAYMATFADPKSAREAASKLGVDAEKLEKILIESRGNHRNIVRAIESLPADKRGKAIALLLNVTEKDRRDIDPSVIIDHVTFTDMDCADDFNAKYVLSPRIENEGLTPWRSILTNRFRGFSDAEMTAFRSDPKALVEWVSSFVAPADNENPQRLRMSPGAVLGEKKGDALSRNIFFVAMARSLGIPARIDPVTGATQYSTDGKTWADAVFSNEEIADDNVSSKGSLMISYQPEGYIVDPKYYSQFSISKIEDGSPRLLEFDEEGSVSTIFATPYELDEGQYILTTGQRLANGGVLAKSEVFFINPGETTNLEMKIRQDNSVLSVIGSLNAENIYHDLVTDEDKSLLSTTGRGYYVLGIISPNHEPSAHALNDISAVASSLQNDGRKIMILFEDADRASRFDKTVFPNLPDNVVFGIDNDGVTRNEIIESLHLENPGQPIFVVADTFNRVVWVSTGYTIGLGETLLNILSRLK